MRAVLPGQSVEEALPISDQSVPGRKVADFRDELSKTRRVQNVINALKKIVGFLFVRYSLPPGNSPPFISLRDPVSFTPAAMYIKSRAYTLVKDAGLRSKTHFDSQTSRMVWPVCIIAGQIVLLSLALGFVAATRIRGHISLGLGPARGARDSNFLVTGGVEVTVEARHAKWSD
ncbi:hypothetical protein GGX14DRAFT_391713 [Mycena pura]|uniref:Uncharacterized protein n=1 Tax=Mycena pura TaxID=153505 RepID=A0AAD6VL48_9AGAR|nr:hypothetical protein GGX14DRAFT_391713 [Mycena pura]